MNSGMIRPSLPSGSAFEHGHQPAAMAQTGNGMVFHTPKAIDLRSYTKRQYGHGDADSELER